MWPDRVSNPGHLTYKSGALPTALRGPANFVINVGGVPVLNLCIVSDGVSYLYSSIQMKCQGGVIFVHAPRLFYCPKRRIGYARCSLTGNKNYSAIIKLTNTM